MSTGPNLAASVRQRLQNLAQARREEFGLLLTRYGVERLLYRLSQSPHADGFVLKGAMLFQTWTGQLHRPTRDLDLLGTGEPSLHRLAAVFREVCWQNVEPDGLQFGAESVVAERIKEEATYEGVRVTLTATLERARIPLQVDVGFGDVVTPAVVELEYPALLAFPPAWVQAYPRETVVAEKVEAMVTLGLANSRMKDFYDLLVLAERFPFRGATLAQAIRATCARRQTELRVEAFEQLLADLAQEPGKQMQWVAFLRRARLAEDRSFSAVLKCLQQFLLPPVVVVAHDGELAGDWRAGGPWPGAGSR